MTARPQRPNIRPARSPGPKPKQPSPRPGQPLSATAPHPEPDPSYKDLAQYQIAAEKKLLAFKVLLEKISLLLGNGRLEEAKNALQDFDCAPPELQGVDK